MKKIINRFVIYLLVLLVVVVATVGCLTSSSALATIIVGSVFGGLWLILVIVNEVYIYWKKRKK